MRKKLLTLAVATVAASSLLTGCGGSSSNDKKAPLVPDPSSLDTAVIFSSDAAYSHFISFIIFIQISFY